MQAGGPTTCVAALIYVYDHHQRELPKRLTRDFHDHHDLAQATLHVHLDHERCMEVTVLKGRGKTCRSLPTMLLPNAAYAMGRSSICRQPHMTMRTPRTPRTHTAIRLPTAKAKKEFPKVLSL